MIALRLGALLAGFALGGCALGPPPEMAVRRSRTAAVEWNPGTRLLSDRLVFESGDGDALRLLVGGRRSLLTLTRLRGEWLAAGPLVGKNWRGSWNTAPPAVAGWISLAEAYEGAAFVPEGESEVRTGRFSVRYGKRGGELRSLELVAIATGDRFRVIFAGGQSRTAVVVRASRTIPL